ncbi:anti-sigma factor family protein [Carboxydothermus ferrireducens]|uniref:Anti-sigma-W factor RsiW n=1 Tax=Carboxydothermus ferrireducens DSM 11255 TaxID=1119529 RepID=A0ABX2R9J2_9THEO|nr:zf-HC2 domain-containing protein [Carboxydothermus ferrireducens]NYE57843.1 hypothetical protein [Carboxydothermus ferrireducens DSM 11255]
MKGRCLDEGILMAYVDDELNLGEMRKVEEHLEECVKCREKLNEIKATRKFTATKLSLLTDGEKAKAPSLRRKFWQNAILPRVAAVAAAALILIGAPAIADELYTFFRAEKVEVVSVNAADLEKLSDIFNKVGESKIEGLIEVKREVTLKPRDLALNDIKNIPASLNPVPENLPSTLEKYAQLNNLYQGEGFKLTVKVNVKEMNRQLKFLGAKKLFPETLEGKEFNISVNPGYRANYNLTGGGNNGGFLSITRQAVPEIKTRARITPEEIAEVLLELPGIPGDLKSSLAGLAGDLNSALVIPVYKGTSVEDVKIAGVTGKMLEQSGGSYRVLVFLKGGILTVIESSLDKETLLEVARGLSW